MTMTEEMAEAIDAAALVDCPLFAARHDGRAPDLGDANRGCIIGADGLALVVSHPWLTAVVPIIERPTGFPYGSIGQQSLTLRCGYIPDWVLAEIMLLLERWIPDEMAAFGIWNCSTREWRVASAEVLRNGAGHIDYKRPPLHEDEYLVVDCHSHPSMSAFFSATDNADDNAAPAKIAVVVGYLDRAQREARARVCIGGRFIELSRQPFETGLALNWKGPSEPRALPATRGGDGSVDLQVNNALRRLLCAALDELDEGTVDGDASLFA